MITDKWLKANHHKPRPAINELADRDGLSVRVSPKGKIVFQMRYRYNGKPCRLDLGSYPSLSLKDAREAHHSMRKQLEEGHNPRTVRLLEKRTIQHAESVQDLFGQWYGKFCEKAKKSPQEIRRTFELYVFKKLGKLPADRVTLHDWLALLEEQVEIRPAIAERILTNAKQMLKWGVHRRLIAVNPLAHVNAKSDLQIKKRAGDRALSEDEILRVWRALDHSRMETKNGLLIKLCLVYGCRNGELRLSEKKHWDLEKGVWTVPPANHKLGKKTGKPLLRPITPEIEPLVRQALALNDESKYVITSRGSNEPMGSSAQLSIPYHIRQWLRKNEEEYEMAHWSTHDLRRTARTNFSTLTQPHIAEIMLGHKLPGSWEVYDRHDYLDEQGKAYSAWCRRLMKLLGIECLTECVPALSVPTPQSRQHPKD